MQYAPENELGVVFLFAELSRRWRLRVETIRPGYPDCIAYQKVGGRERQVRIEFEFRSRNFFSHRHKARGCDWLVCWEHNWPACPERIRVVELRREFGLGFNVWVQPVSGEYKQRISAIDSDPDWSAPSRAQKGDLLLFYHNRPDMSIKDLFVLRGPVRRKRAGWRPGMDYMAPIRRVCRLDAPVFLEDLRRDRIVRTAGFVRKNMLGRPNATEHWPYVYDMIVRRNPSVRRRLAKFAPDQLG
jgi:hypothetical protein